MSNLKKIIIIILLGAIIIVIGFIFWSKYDKTTLPINTNEPVYEESDVVGKVESKIGNIKTEKIQIKFSMEVDGMKYSDALYMTEDEYKMTSPEKLEEMKMERFKNWVNSINSNSINNAQTN